ncbi:16S rRNA processing protein RimM [Roseiarcus fermentans]|uniref:Ribosome maturation factor RimM n=1 Tax=Roseiarcus fermentans TaxID=1473586 RepID=A0A366FQV2_9HYPH|nr:ribosome maturation factor RimM [Roseiarcus fermentans]RBP16526.1 16S rRNA processing protein RimM [Roseiarcus fermentans]
MGADRFVLVGRFGAPQGVRGEVRVQSFTVDPKAIGAYGPLTDAARTRDFSFERLRPLKDAMLAAKVKGVETREAAAALTGVELFASRDRLPAPSEDEFYHDDLIGLAAVTADGRALGRVVAVSNYGAGDILEIAPGGGGESLLVPFTRAVVPEIDFAAGRMVVAPPADT